MLSFKERLNLLEQDLMASPPGFVMSADLPFAIFRYDPHHPEENEWRVRRESRRLAIRLRNATGVRVHLVSLARLYWKGIERSEEGFGLQEIIELERARGFVEAETQVSTYLNDPEWHPLPDILIEVVAEMQLFQHQDLLFLLRGGVFAPSSYRISSLLEQLMGKMRIPAVLFYPGTWHQSLNYLGLRLEDEPLSSYRVKIYGRDS